MIEIDEDGLMICKMQGKLFVDSLKFDESSSSMFIRRYMNSKMCERFDYGYMLAEASCNENYINELKNEYNHKIYGKERYAKEELYWIGYVFRYWAITYKVSSKYIYKVINGGEMRSLYYPYHSLDPKMAIERILEAKGLGDPFSIEYGVAVARKYYKTNKN